MTKKIYEDVAKEVKAKKPRAKRVIGKIAELAAPYEKKPRKSRAKPKPFVAPVYKTPGICGATRDVLLNGASGYTPALMSTYNKAFVEQQAEQRAERILRMLDHKTAPASFDTKPRLHLRP
jgi:hypothetical protein